MRRSAMWTSVALFAAGCGISHTTDAGIDGGAPRWDARVDRFDAGTMDARVDTPDAGLPATCVVGTAAPCDCPGELSGYRYCGMERRWGPCECPVPIADAGTPDDGGALEDASAPDASVPCTGDEEWCDGFDNDCDGAIDEGEPCPDSSVRNTFPYEGAVWLRGVTDGSCPTSGIQRVWPSIADQLIGLGCIERNVSFRADREIFFLRRWSLYREDLRPDEEIPTPPCFGSVRSYGFDGADQVFYQCPDSLRRGNGEIVTSYSASIAAVLSSGRVLIYGSTAPAFTLLSENGDVLSSFDIEDWVGAYYVGRATSFGDSAFVTFRRTYRDETRTEIVVVRVDGASAAWRLVRRVPVPPRMYESLALPDGRLLGFTQSNTGMFRLYEFPPDGPPRLLLRSDSSRVVFEEWTQLLTGPVDALR